MPVFVDPDAEEGGAAGADPGLLQQFALGGLDRVLCGLAEPAGDIPVILPRVSGALDEQHTLVVFDDRLGCGLRIVEVGLTAARAGHGRDCRQRSGAAPAVSGRGGHATRSLTGVHVSAERPRLSRVMCDPPTAGPPPTWPRAAWFAYGAEHVLRIRSRGRPGECGDGATARLAAVQRCQTTTSAASSIGMLAAPKSTRRERSGQERKASGSALSRTRAPAPPRHAQT